MTTENKYIHIQATLYFITLLLTGDCFAFREESQVTSSYKRAHQVPLFTNFIMMSQAILDGDLLHYYTPILNKKCRKMRVKYSENRYTCRQAILAVEAGN